MARLCKPKGSKFGVNLLKRNGFNVPPEQTMEYLFEVHCPGSKPAERRTFHRRKIKVDEALKRLHFINRITLGSSFAGFGAHKAPGPDKLRPVMLQHLTNDMLERLAFLIQCSIALAHTPTIWLGSTVLFLSLIHI